MRALCLSLLLAALSTQAFGHARLSTSTPEDGGRITAGTDTVRLQFSEPVQPRFSDFSLHYLGEARDGEATAENRLPGTTPTVDETRQQVDLPLPESPEPGWYLLDWHVLADDGHTTAGTVRFEIAP